MASWGVQQKGGSSRLSRLVTEVHSTPQESGRGQEPGTKSRGTSREAGRVEVHSDEEEEEENVSEDEEEL